MIVITHVKQENNNYVERIKIYFRQTYRWAEMSELHVLMH